MPKKQLTAAAHTSRRCPTAKARCDRRTARRGSDGPKKTGNRSITHQLPKVCVLPYGQRLGWKAARLSLSDLHWPLGTPTDIQGKTLADLEPKDHLLTPPHTTLYFRPSFGTRARVSVMFLEPRAVHHKHMSLIRLFHRRFHRVLTADTDLLAQCPNAAFFPIAGSWVPDWQKSDLTKHAMCSLIASAKTKQPGHKLRHVVANWSRETGQDIDIMGRGYKPFDAKSEGLAPFRYSIVIENVREENYFSEKLIDALLCRTVPIYWGCPNIGDFLDTDAMMICEDMADIQRAVAQMSTADYAARMAALDAARQVAAGYVDFYKRAAKTVLEHG